MSTSKAEIRDSIDRSVHYVADGDISFLEIEVTRKEAVDVDNAIKALLRAASPDAYGATPPTDHRRPNRPVASFNRVWIGGYHSKKNPTIMIEDGTDATILLDALRLYSPDEADFTRRLREAILTALVEYPLGINIDAVLWPEK